MKEGGGGTEGRMVLLLVVYVGRGRRVKKAPKLEVDAPLRSFAATAAGKLRYAGGRGAQRRGRSVRQAGGIVFLQFVLVQKIRFEIDRNRR